MLPVLVALLTVSLAAPPIDPDTYRNFSQIIITKGYPCEQHYVTTADGYVLGAFRVPYGRSGPGNGARAPVILQHGLLDSSFSFIMNEPTESLPYILADAGFDVWMPNSRGNIYSEKSTRYSVNTSAFWAFSWDQMAMYDVPANINYVLGVNGAKTVGYIGHSQGTTQMFAAMALNPGLAAQVNLFVAMGPVTHVGYETNSALRYAADTHLAEFLIRTGVNKDFLEGASKLLKNEFAEACYVEPLVCDDLIEMICGKHQGAFNNSRMPLVATHEPGGTSMQNMAHWEQMVRCKCFQMYDYGSPAANQAHYNQTSPPVYDMSRFPTSLPVALYSGSADELADPKDVANLIASLPTPPIVADEIPGFAHLDFLWDYESATIFYPQVVSLLQSHKTG